MLVRYLLMQEPTLEQEYLVGLLMSYLRLTLLQSTDCISVASVCGGVVLVLCT